jgi:hypothetical protein
MDSRLMFLDCPAYLDRAGGERCGLPAEVRCRSIMRSAGGPLESAMIGCPAGHWPTGPVESLTLTTGPGRAAALPCSAEHGGRPEQAAAMLTGRARTGIALGAALPAAPLPRCRFLRRAGQVIVWLLLAGVAAAVACVLLGLVPAPGGGVGPHPPGPPPHPVPTPNLSPAPPGS